MIVRQYFTDSCIEKCTILRFRTKLGENTRYEGIELLAKLLKNHKTSFAYVFKKPAKNLLPMVITGIRDYDVLEESLGTKYYSLFNNSSFQINKK